MKRKFVEVRENGRMSWNEKERQKQKGKKS